MHRTSLFCASVVLAATVVGCGPSKRDAQAYVESQGVSNVTLTRNGKAFDFTGTKGDDFCTGTVTVQKGFGTTNQTFFITCGADARACKAGAPAECVRIADKLYDKDAKVFPTQAADLYRTACTDKNGHACGRVAEFENIDKKYDQVREFAKKGCDLDDGDACARLGRSELQGLGTSKDPVKALELFKKACDKGSLSGCRAAAGLLVDRDPPDNTGALPFASKACAAKFEDGCIVQGLVLFRTKEYAKALPLLEPGCAQADQTTHAFSCNLAGAILYDGLGTKKDLPRGVEYFEKACAADNEDGCVNAGRAYKLGMGAKRDAAKSAELYAKACKLGATKYCTK